MWPMDLLFKFVMFFALFPYYLPNNKGQFKNMVVLDPFRSYSTETNGEEDKGMKLIR